MLESHHVEAPRTEESTLHLSVWVDQADGVSSRAVDLCFPFLWEPAFLPLEPTIPIGIPEGIGAPLPGEGGRGAEQSRKW